MGFITGKHHPVMAVLIVLVALFGGCSDGQAPPQTPAPQKTREVTLFFGDRQAMHVIPETRSINPGSKLLGSALIAELIKGPDDPFLIPTMPAGTRLLSFSVRDGVATVDFSTELRDNHPGGSAGETMTIDSIVFTLTELPGVRKVQILIDGKKVETLLGHVVFEEPFDRGPIRTHKVFLDKERQAWLQGLVDAGRQRWRLDPVEVARREGRLAGFMTTNNFTLSEKSVAAPGTGDRPGGDKAAAVRAVYNDSELPRPYGLCITHN